MPSKLFQKRKEEAKRRADREAKLRAEQVRILLVSEGSKTEPNYLVEFFRLDGGSRIEPFATRDHNTSPTTLLNQAKAILQDDEDFDLAFIVGDRDEFDDFAQAVDAAPRLKTTPKLKYIYSDPCFELWFLLHFEFWDAPIDRHAIRDELKRHIPNYQKRDQAIAREIYEKTDIAMQNSVKLRAKMECSDSTCPTTLVDILISDVRKLIQQRENE
ncbi:MAG: RloB domain-containing protein [Sphingomonadaceae bacterium]|nr:RloB domain-containing protein [Altererythrobacter sp.]MCP5392022.1 RloB domain-containing protein [Sphingomonadaceae bacterium]MCP5395000.1 RloB domain-containing protein [Sphingomonadaceae bacterium]